MPNSEPPSPIYGYRHGRPVRALSSDSALEQIEQLVSPIRRTPGGTSITRRPRVAGPYIGPLTRRRASTRSSSGDSYIPSSRTSSLQSLQWDNSYSDHPTFLENFSSETQFDVPLDNSIHESRIEEVNNQRRPSASSSDEEFLDPNTSNSSHETIKMAPPTGPAAAAGGAATNIDDGAVGGGTERLKLPANPAQDVAQNVKRLRRAEISWHDDYNGLNPATLSQNRLEKKVERAEQLRDEVVDAILDFEDVEPDFWTEDATRISNLIKQDFSRWIRLADQVLHGIEEREVERDRAEDVAIQVKKARVAKHRDSLVTDMKNMKIQLDALAKAEPPDEPSYLIHQEQVTEYRGKVKTIVDDAKAMVDDATDAGMADAASTLDEEMRKLKKSDVEAAGSLLDKKSAFGIISGSAHSHKTDIPVPKFSGNPADPDYYTFHEEWNQYTSSKVMSEAEKFRVLTRTCLTGTARSISKRFKTVPEILEHLKKTYGNPRYLLTSRLEEIRKLGPCTGSDVKKREWVVDVRARMDDVHKLAEAHNLLDKLYHSTIVGEIQEGMAYNMVKEYKKLVRKASPTGDLSAAGYWTNLCTYLDTLVDELIFEVNHALNIGVKTSSSKPKDDVKKPFQPARKVYTATAAEVDSDEPAQPAQQPTGKAKKAKVSNKTSKNKKSNDSYNSNVMIPATYVEPTPVNCAVCNHSHTHLFCCTQFQKARGKDRFGIASKVRACFRCLRMDAGTDMKNRVAWWAHHEANCITTWVCAFEKCPTMEKMKQFHILMCTFHIDQNKEKERAFIADMDQKQVKPGLRFFFNQAMFQLDAQAVLPHCGSDNVIADISAPSIFMLQYVERDGKSMLMFYDSGCGGAALSDRAATILNSICVREGPTLLNVAGGATVKIDRGDESFKLALDKPKTETEQIASMTGLRMPTVTTRFPVWDISAAWGDIVKELDQTFPNHEPLPLPPQHVGGDPVDLMVGIRYIKYHPKLLYMLPSGLGVYKSRFAAPRGETCILGGPHPSWERCREASNYLGPHTFFSSEMRAYYFACTTVNHVFSPNKSNFIQTNSCGALEGDLEGGEGGEDVVGGVDLGGVDLGGGVDLWELEDGSYHPGLDPWDLDNLDDDVLNNPIVQEDICCTFSHCSNHGPDNERWIIPSDWDTTTTIYSLRADTSKFLDGEMVGSEIQYRCLKCRNCSQCRKSEVLEATSIREEAEQALIESSVEFFPEQKRLVSKLPFIDEPKENLFSNKYLAQKVLDSQMKKISSSEDMKLDVLASFEKLASRNYLIPVSKLDEESRNLVTSEHDAGYFIPWRTVYKQSSISTPCRLVFDASARTPGGKSLNEILAKGENRLASIMHILLKFRNKASAFCTDIRLAYNQIRLDPSHYRYQKFLWREGLQLSNPVVEYIISTCIYGVKPVGNTLEAGCGKVGDYCITYHPEHTAGAEALKKSAYVDDVGHADHTPELSRSTAASLDFTLGLANMEVKGYTFSGEDPPPEVSADGKSVGLLGLNWTPKEDILGLVIKPLYFGKPKRGKLPEFVTGNFTDALKKNFTRRNMLGKVAGVFDPLGLVTPITAQLKLDLHDLVELKLDWDARIPDELLDKWVRNINDIQAVREVKFRRSIIPVDAVSPDVEIIVSADASQFIAVATVHSRVLRRNGEYSCQLMTAKSKLVKELTIPKAELRAAVLATHLAHTVKFNLAEQFRSSIYVTDSSIVMFWVNQDERPLEVTVRNCVIEIRRFCSPSQWHHVNTDLNIADLGTRPTAISEISEGSHWQLGKPWMSADRQQMPIKTLEQVRLSLDEKKAAALETRNDNAAGIALPFLATKVNDRYCFSSYICDPNRYNWAKSVRVVSYMLKFIRACKPSWKPIWQPFPKPTDEQVVFTSVGVNLTEFDHRFGEKYYFYLATQEVEKYVPPKDLKDTDKRDGVLFYVGRILDGQQIHSPVDNMFDLQPLHFVKPVVDRYSPVAYSIMVYAHSTLTHHRNSAATLRTSREIAYILRGRDLAVEIREACRPCIRFKAKLLKVEMGKVHDSRLTIAPAFYICQVDLLGPLIARCNHNHRSTVKVWGCVFKDPASSAVSAHAMAGYSTDEFLASYTRFSSRYGHPSRLCIDEGSQLLAACRRMELSITDITNSLSTQYSVGVQFTTCPVGGHNVHGVVERSIQNIQNLFDKVYKGIKLDVLGYETCFAWICSQLNNIPLCIGSRTDNLDSLDLITPSRLLLGRASTRAIGGHARISPPSKMVQQMDSVYESWWNIWQQELLTSYVPQPSKWSKSNEDLKVGDIVLMLQNNEEVKLGGPIWRIARVQAVETSHRDGSSRVATCEYRIPGEKDFRTTRRSVRKLAVVHQEDALDIVQQLNQAAKDSGTAYHAARLREPP